MSFTIRQPTKRSSCFALASTVQTLLPAIRVDGQLQATCSGLIRSTLCLPERKPRYRLMGWNPGRRYDCLVSLSPRRTGPSVTITSACPRRCIHSSYKDTVHNRTDGSDKRLCLPVSTDMLTTILPSGNTLLPPRNCF